LNLGMNRKKKKGRILKDIKMNYLTVYIYAEKKYVYLFKYCFPHYYVLPLPYA